MDYIIFSLGTMGDNQPFIRISAELVKRGKKVVFLGNERFAQPIQDLGIEFRAVSTEQEYVKAYNNQATWSHYHSKEHYREYHLPAILPTYKIIQELANSGNRPFLLFQDPMSGAKMASHELNLPSCRIILAPSALYSAEEPTFPLRQQIPEKDWAKILPQLKEKEVSSRFSRFYTSFINPLREELGLKALLMDDLERIEQSKNNLALFPDWLKAPPSDWPEKILLTGFPLDNHTKKKLDNEITNFIKSKGKPIVYSFGTGVPVSQMILKKIKKISEILELPSILIGKTLANSESYALDENILSVPFIDFSSIFPEARAIIHHGGIGTCAEGLAAGVPQLITPFAFDQPDNAYLLWKLGVANAVDFQRDGAREISNVVKSLIESSETHDTCSRYRKLCDIDCLKKAVDAIEKIKSQEEAIFQLDLPSAP